ncbi:hypothetical protein E3Q23_03906 [Wallemia mellicola]|uniref:Bicupin, oxalate decarboxylase/oxidase n=1 Tax=Wallemia mellicola TaxID=1708541 RepID=A0A4T0RPX2_9BASI|nr:hypothetical protein E3Q23_03906 [Wallemia mellicola]TIC37467.1 Bicupin, oxalate decarboxylase/oxidase [Wallemia mellicola]TIC62542.1 Bicupin, oxalate decarboxylase/oxidase [Wallemia mellicola]
MFKKAVYFALLAGTYAQSNGTIDLADPEPGNWGGNIGKAATKHYNDFDYEVFMDDSYIPRPYRYELGSDYTVNENVMMDRQSPDTLAPPTVDFGSIENPRWHMSDSYNRLAIGGYARQQTVKDLPVAVDIAGVDMKLEPGAFRESHWHEQSEWAYMFSGRVIISAINPDGQTFMGELGPGDVWFFPSSYIHSIQALEDGAEFLLIFDSGEFDENSTFLSAEALSRIPKSVINKNFGLAKDATDFDNIPAQQLYIFRGEMPIPSFEEQKKSINNPFGMMENQTLLFPLSQMPWDEYDGGRVRIVDSSNFNAPSLDITVAQIQLDSGSLRTLHWHETASSAEWDFIISGTLRATIYAGNGNSRTYDFNAMDVGYIEANNLHYLECVSEEPCEFLAAFKTSKYNDFEFGQFVTATPRYTIQQHLRITDETFDAIQESVANKQIIVPNNCK